MNLKRPGVVKARGSRRVVFCDYDTEHPPRLITLWRTLAQIGLRSQYVRYDRTERGWHVVIGFRRGFTSGELVAMQFALGSDRKRERYNLRRVICGARPADWNLLFHFKLQQRTATNARLSPARPRKSGKQLDLVVREIKF